MSTEWFNWHEPGCGCGCEKPDPHPYQPGCLCPACTRCRNADAENAEQAARIEAGKAAADEEIEAYRARLRAAMADDPEYREPLIMPDSYVMDEAVVPGPFICPGCGFTFLSRTAAATSCQYCGEKFPALPEHAGMPLSAGGPFAVTRVRETRPGVWIPDENGAYAIQAGQAASDPAPEAGPEPQDEVTMLWRSFFEPLFLSPAELDTLAPFAPAGSCRTCHLPAVAGKPLCPYCAALTEVRAKAARDTEVRAELLRRPAHPHRGLVTRAVLLTAGIMLVILAVHGLFPLILPAIAFIGLAVSGLRR